MSFPLARSDKLTIRELAGETLIYDLARHKAHCLNSTVALVWRHCDGRTTLVELAAVVQRELQVADAKAVVDLALEQLSRRNLLAQPWVPLTASQRLARREILKKLAVAAVLLPLVMTITARRVAASSRSFGDKCKQDGDCIGDCQFVTGGGFRPLRCRNGLCACPDGWSPVGG